MARLTSTGQTLTDILASVGAPIQNPASLTGIEFELYVHNLINHKVITTTPELCGLTCFVLARLESLKPLLQNQRISQLLSGNDKWHSLLPILCLVLHRVNATFEAAANLYVVDVHNLNQISADLTKADHLLSWVTAYVTDLFKEINECVEDSESVCVSEDVTCELDDLLDRGFEINSPSRDKDVSKAPVYTRPKYGREDNNESETHLETLVLDSLTVGHNSSGNDHDRSDLLFVNNTNSHSFNEPKLTVLSTTLPRPNAEHVLRLSLPALFTHLESFTFMEKVLKCQDPFAVLQNGVEISTLQGYLEKEFEHNLSFVEKRRLRAFLINLTDAHPNNVLFSLQALSFLFPTSIALNALREIHDEINKQVELQNAQAATMATKDQRSTHAASIAATLVKRIRSTVSEVAAPLRSEPMLGTFALSSGNALMYQDIISFLENASEDVIEDLDVDHLIRAVEDNGKDKGFNSNTLNANSNKPSSHMNGSTKISESLTLSMHHLSGLMALDNEALANTWRAPSKNVDNPKILFALIFSIFEVLSPRSFVALALGSPLKDSQATSNAFLSLCEKQRSGHAMHSTVLPTAASIVKDQVQVNKKCELLNVNSARLVSNPFLMQTLAATGVCDVFALTSFRSQTAVNVSFYNNNVNGQICESCAIMSNNNRNENQEAKGVSFLSELFETDFVYNDFQSNGVSLGSMNSNETSKTVNPFITSCAYNNGALVNRYCKLCNETSIDFAMLSDTSGKGLLQTFDSFSEIAPSIAPTSVTSLNNTVAIAADNMSDLVNNNTQNTLMLTGVDPSTAAQSQSATTEVRRRVSLSIPQPQSQQLQPEVVRDVTKVVFENDAFNVDLLYLDFSHVALKNAFINICTGTMALPSATAPKSKTSTSNSFNTTNTTNNSSSTNGARNNNTTNKVVHKLPSSVPISVTVLNPTLMNRNSEKSAPAPNEVAAALGCIMSGRFYSSLSKQFFSQVSVNSAPVGDPKVSSLLSAAFSTPSKTVNTISTPQTNGSGAASVASVLSLEGVLGSWLGICSSAFSFLQHGLKTNTTSASLFIDVQKKIHAGLRLLQRNVHVPPSALTTGTGVSKADGSKEVHPVTCMQLYNPTPNQPLLQWASLVSSTPEGGSSTSRVSVLPVVVNSISTNDAEVVLQRLLQAEAEKFVIQQHPHQKTGEGSTKRRFVYYEQQRLARLEQYLMEECVRGMSREALAETRLRNALLYNTQQNNIHSRSWKLLRNHQTKVLRSRSLVAQWKEQIVALEEELVSITGPASLSRSPSFLDVAKAMSRRSGRLSMLQSANQESSQGHGNLEPLYARLQSAMAALTEAEDECHRVRTELLFNEAQWLEEENQFCRKKLFLEVCFRKLHSGLTLVRRTEMESALVVRRLLSQVREAAYQSRLSLEKEAQASLVTLERVSQLVSAKEEALQSLAQQYASLEKRKDVAAALCLDRTTELRGIVQVADLVRAKQVLESHVNLLESKVDVLARSNNGNGVAVGGGNGVRANRLSVVTSRHQ